MILRRHGISKFIRLALGCAFLCGMTSSAKAGFIVVSNSSSLSTITSGTATQAATADGLSLQVKFADRIVGGNITTGVDAGKSKLSNGNQASNTQVYVGNTKNSSNNSTSSSAASFSVTSGSLVGGTPANTSSLAVGTSTSLALSLDGSTAGQKTAVIDVHRGTPYASSAVNFGSPALSDTNRTITLTADVYDHSNASYDANSNSRSLTLDFGQVMVGQTGFLGYDIFNREATVGFTSVLQLTNIAGSSSIFSSGASTFTGGDHLDPGSFYSFTAEFSPTSAGFFSYTYTFTMNDDTLLEGTGANTEYLMTLTVQGEGIYVPEPSGLSLAAFGAMGLFAASRIRRRQNS